MATSPLLAQTHPPIVCHSRANCCKLGRWVHWCIDVNWCPIVGISHKRMWTVCPQAKAHLLPSCFVLFETPTLSLKLAVSIASIILLSAFGLHPRRLHRATDTDCLHFCTSKGNRIVAWIVLTWTPPSNWWWRWWYLSREAFPYSAQFIKINLQMVNV